MEIGKKYLPFLLLAAIFLIIIPVPTIVLDMLLIVNIALAAIIFLISLNTDSILDFSMLPTLLIFTTLFRIILNVTSSRLILGEATGGALIDSIGNFAIGGNYVVGGTIFLIITIVMFLVITKGLERVSEISARFTLDALPGKQMSIDAELSSGMISSEEAKRRRANLQKEVDFYKSMDGASKFIKGDTIAGIIITIINIVLGLVMGIMSHGMTIGEAASKYTILSIGDGLVNQVPALLIAVATALMVTKSGEKDIMNDLIYQFMRYKKPLLTASIVFAILTVLGVVGILDGLPIFITGAMAGFLYWLYNMESPVEEIVEEQTEIEVDENEVVYETSLYQDKILVKVGDNLIPIVSKTDAVTGKVYASPEILEKMETLKNNIRSDYGYKIPEIIMNDKEYMASNSFAIKIPNVQTKDISIKPNCVVAQFLDEDTVYDLGEPVVFPEIGISGVWVNKSSHADMISKGAIVYTIPEIIILYLEHVIVNNLDKLITRKDINLFKEEVARYNDAIIDEINNKNIENAIIQKVVQNLLREKISIKNFEYILESICDCIIKYRGNATTDLITQFVRMRLINVLTADKIEDGVLNIVTFTEDTNETIKQFMDGKNMSQELMQKCSSLYVQIATLHRYYENLGQSFVFICDASIRKYVFDVIANMGDKICIISKDEVPVAKYNQLKEI